MSNPVHIDDKEFLSRIYGGDKEAFDLLFNKYYNRIYGKALQLCKVPATAQDVAQHVFLKVWEKKKELLSVQNPEAWLFTIARYQIVDMLRNQLMQEKYERYSFDILDQEIASPEQLLITRQQKQLLDKSKETLSPKQREVYSMNREQGLTYMEIADKLGISRDTVKEYVGIAIAKIKQFMVEHKEEWILACVMAGQIYF